MEIESVCVCENVRGVCIKVKVCFSVNMTGVCFKGRLRVCLYESERSVICGIQ